MRRRGLLSLLVFSLLAGRIAGAEPDQADPAPDSPPIAWESHPGAPQASDLLWQSSIGQAGSLTVCGDKVLVGGGTQYHPDAPDAMSGVMECLSAQTGRLLWRVKHDRIPQRVHDMVSCISSRPFVDGDRVYYVSNRGELCCVGLNDGRVLWMLDMPRELGVFKRDPMDILDLAPSPIVIGGVVYCVTGNGAVPIRNVPAPKAPSFVAVDRWTGKMIWSSNAPGSKIIYGQWSTPAHAVVDGIAQILFPGIHGGLCRDGNMLYVGASDSVLALATATGQIVDECKFSGLIRGTPVIADGRLFVFSFDRVWAIRLPK